MKKDLKLRVRADKLSYELYIIPTVRYSWGWGQWILKVYWLTFEIVFVVEDENELPF